jgi:MFS family permease
VVLGLVSLLNDTASEMITPLLPLFLTATLGAGPAVVGLVEGVAEATASLLKVVSGWLADRGWNRKGLVVGGYGVSNTARPLIGVALGWVSVLSLRFLDRVGKGVRTAPRDALIAAAVAEEDRGRAFGLQRGLDHTGAMIGPLAAFALLAAGLEMRTVFLASALPGLLVVILLIAALPATPSARPAPGPTPARLRWRGLDHRLRGLILASGGLALATTPEAFVILWAQARGMTVAHIPLVWAAAHAAKAAVAAPAGVLSDRAGRLPVVVTGWIGRIVLLVAFALAGDGSVTVWGLFLAYAAALAATEGAERALVGDCAPPEARATVYGLYHLACGLCALPGALLFGVLWQLLGQRTAFLCAAAVTALAAAALVWLSRAAATPRGEGRPGRTAV